MHIPENLSGFIIWFCWHLVLVKGWLESYFSSTPKKDKEGVKETPEECCGPPGTEQAHTTSRLRRKLFGRFYKTAKARVSNWKLGSRFKFLQRSVPVEPESKEVGS